jgi:16S rRNA (adenine1518-N6/adenine1519-N6)-dimethyltransferase
MIQINYNSTSALRTLLDEEGLGMRKKYGQNFLLSPRIRQSLTDALGAKSGDCVWEVGPGLGAMTALLLEKGFNVLAFEIDPGFIRILKRIFADEKNFSLVEGDFLKTWKEHKWKERETTPYLLGNLPYNIAAALLADLIENRQLFSRIVVTVQKEVALRMAASAGSPDYSSFSVLCSSVYKVKPLMLISPSSFYPQPNVESMGVLLENKKTGVYPSIYYPLVRSLFASRRKTIKNNMTAFIASCMGKFKSSGISVQDVCAAVLSENGFSGMERAERLEPEAFLSLAKSIENMRILKKE